MKTKFFLLVFITIALVGCKESNSSSKVYIENKSSATVELKFSLARTNESKTVRLYPNQEILTKTISGMGNSGIPYYPFDMQYDTCSVIFNDSLFIEYSLYQKNERNILFTDYYNVSDGTGSRKYDHFIFRYTITEQDFLNAEPL
jgi:hypothetical protein